MHLNKNNTETASKFVVQRKISICLTTNYQRLNIEIRQRSL